MRARHRRIGARPRARRWRESGDLWSTFAGVAAQNPNSWLKKNFAPDQITTPTPDNRLIAWPYTKLMVANPAVNMGGALILTSLAKARAAGVPEDRIVYALGGASAEEPRDYLIRDQFFESHPQNAVLKAIMDLVEGDGKKFDAIELYSCFPVVPKMARRTLGLGAGREADGHRRAHLLRRAAQHLHDACGLRDGAKLARARQARPALRPGRVCHQAPCAGAVARGAEARRWRRTPACRRKPTAIAARCRISSIAAGGKGKVEAFTVIYRGNGEIEHGVTMLRTEDDRRTLGRIPASDAKTLAHLLNMDRTPVGTIGDIVTAADGVPEWRVA